MLTSLRTSLHRTRNRIQQSLRKLSGDTSAEDRLKILEEVLFAADLGPIALNILEEAEKKLLSGDFNNAHAMQHWLQIKLEQLAGNLPYAINENGDNPQVILIAGVNGSGKTTSLAKLANWLKSKNNDVVIAAGDTYRAAATEQLEVWCKKINAPLIKGKENMDPASVVHDAAQYSLKEKSDYLLIDTAGRLHTQKNLMSELNKICRVLNKIIPGAPHHTLLVLDATTGQNAIQQAKKFGEILPLSAIILSKLDGTAKGGAVLSIKQDLRIPVAFIGSGEDLNDWQIFDAKEFIKALLHT